MNAPTHAHQDRLSAELRGHAYQRTELTAVQRDIFAALQVPEPPRFLHLASAD